MITTNRTVCTIIVLVKRSERSCAKKIRRKGREHKRVHKNRVPELFLLKNMYSSLTKISRKEK